MTIDASAVARVLGINTVFRDLRGGSILFLPQRLAIFAQGASAASYALDKFQATSSGQVGAALGFGSPAHLIARELFPDNGDGVGSIPVTFYPLEDDGSGVAAAGDITPSGAQTKAAAYRVRISGVSSEAFVVSPGDTVAAIVTAMTQAVNAVLEMPMIASDDTTEMGLAAKWAGVSSNDLTVEVIGEDLGTVFTIVQPTGGLVNPDTAAINAALAQVGNVWESMGLNALDPDDTDALDAYQAWGEGRWGQTVRKPLVMFYGNTDVAPATVITNTDGRNDDRVNSQLTAPGSVNLPCVIAARQLARIAVLANNNPPHDYGSQRADGLIPGADADQWGFPERDLIVKGGSSTSEVRDGVVTLSDTVTPWSPTTEPIPGYRYVVDIVKLQQIIFNLALIFEQPEWDGAPLIPDDQPTTNRDAKQPKMAKAAINSMIDSLGFSAIISDPTTAKTKTVAVINSQNPKRLDCRLTVQLSGNTNIKDVELNFGFFFGTQAAA